MYLEGLLKKISINEYIYHQNSIFVDLFLFFLFEKKMEEKTNEGKEEECSFHLFCVIKLQIYKRQDGRMTTPKGILQNFPTNNPKFMDKTFKLFSLPKKGPQYQSWWRKPERETI